MFHTPFRRRVAAILSVPALVVAGIPGTAAGDPDGGSFCSAKGSGGANPDTAKVREVVNSAVASAQQGGWKMGVAIGGAGNKNPVITAGTANEAVYSASTIKVAVGAAAYKADVASKQTDDMRAMLGASDNEATNRLIDAVGGFDPVNAIIKDAGVDAKDYKLGNKMGGPTSEQASLLSATGGAKFLMALCNAAAVKDGVLSQDQARGLLTMMGDTSIKEGAALEKLKVGFERIADKTGEHPESKDGAVSHDIGIVGKGNHWFAIAVTTQGQSDGRGQIAELSKKLAPLFET